VTTEQGPRWVSVAKAAEYLGMHRQHLHRMIRIGTFDRRYLDRTGPTIRILITPDLERDVRNGMRLRAR